MCKKAKQKNCTTKYISMAHAFCYFYEIKWNQVVCVCVCIQYKNERHVHIHIEQRTRREK